MNCSVAVENRIAPEARSGHLSVFYNGYLLVLGGYKFDLKDEERYFSMDVLWMYDLQSYIWKTQNLKGHIPDGGTGASAIVVDDNLILFGGMSGTINNQINKLYILSLKTFIWEHLCSSKVKGAFPSSRDKFVSWKFNNQLFIFGGYGARPFEHCTGDFILMNELFPNGWNNHLFSLNCRIEPFTWSQPECYGEVPSPRAAHACTVVNERCYIFGGRSECGRSNDLFCFDYKKLFWNKCCQPDSKLPPGRSWHSLERLTGSRLFLYGGIDAHDNLLKDTWIFDIDKNCWEEIENGSSKLDITAPRMLHTSCQTHREGEIVIFGGSISSVFLPNEQQTNSVTFFRFTPLPLQDICLQFIKQNSDKINFESMSLPKCLKKLIELIL